MGGDLFSCLLNEIPWDINTVAWIWSWICNVNEL